MSGRFGANTTTSSTVSSSLHSIRRAPLDPMFSKGSITKFEPIVHEKVELLSKQIAEYNENGRVLSFNNAANSFAGDVIASYCFGFSYHQLESPDFHDNFHSAYEAIRKFSHFGLQFPSVFIVSRGCSPRDCIETHLQSGARFESKGVVEDGGAQHPQNFCAANGMYKRQCIIPTLLTRSRTSEAKSATSSRVIIRKKQARTQPRPFLTRFSGVTFRLLKRQSLD